MNKTHRIILRVKWQDRAANSMNQRKIIIINYLTYARWMHTHQNTHTHISTNSKFFYVILSSKQHCMPRLYTTITIIITDNNIKLLLCAVCKCFFMDLYNSFLIFFLSVFLVYLLTLPFAFQLLPENDYMNA